MGFYHWLTHVGINDDLPVNERKRVLTINKIWLLLNVIGVLGIPTFVAIWLVLIQVDPVKYQDFYFFSLYLSGYIVLNMIGYFLKSLPLLGVLMATVAMNTLQAFILGMCMLIGPQFRFETMLFLLFIFPYFLLPRSAPWSLAWAFVTNVACLIFIYAWYEHGQPWFVIEYEPVRQFGQYAVVTMTGLSFIGCMYHMAREGMRADDTIAAEQAKVQNLLLNILPEDVAEELKEKGAAEPVSYDSVTVLFTDFVGFTRIAEDLSAHDLIDELDKCFSYFDAVTRKYNLEKIKTIGDSYMLAAGLPEANKTHAVDALLGAMEIQSFIEQMKQIKEQQNLPYWELRLGINSGPLVAGVIGEMKFAYDVFGDTVNTASRMESSGESGRINISRATHDLVERFFDCKYRGKVTAKNKGEVEMYFVNGLRAEFSKDGEGKVPNDKFAKAYQELKNG